MVVTKNALVEEIKKHFPRVNKPENYADLILEGKKLNAVDAINAKKRKFFLESEIISASIFHSSYSRLGLLDRLKNADKTIAVSSTRRVPGFAMSHSMILSYLNYERHLLYTHIPKDQRVKKIICNVLRIPIMSSIELIQRKMELGNPYHQVGVYKQIYEKIKREGIPIDCMWLGVVALPADLYYLSDLSNSLLRKVR